MVPIFIKAERGPRMDLRKRTSRPEQKNEQQQKKKTKRNWPDGEWAPQEDEEQQQDLRE